MTIPYGLQAAGELLTDAVSPPRSAFSTPGWSLPPFTDTFNVTHPVTSSAVLVPQAVIAKSTTLSDLFMEPEALPLVDGEIVFSGSFAFTINPGAVPMPAPGFSVVATALAGLMAIRRRARA